MSDASIRAMLNNMGAQPDLGHVSWSQLPNGRAGVPWNTARDLLGSSIAAQHPSPAEQRAFGQQVLHNFYGPNSIDDLVELTEAATRLGHTPAEIVSAVEAGHLPAVYRVESTGTSLLLPRGGLGIADALGGAAAVARPARGLSRWILPAVVVAGLGAAAIAVAQRVTPGGTSDPTSTDAPA
ncbi:MAG: hypothetical protein H7287_02055, partial [Thermoleophilia bacterium]|nr:hypothetical protein [Thermoleophilia bacterium]